MKCIQRLCSRTKNLKESGYCNICNDLVEDLKKKYERIEKPTSFQKVELDLKLLIDTHSKLVSGKLVEPQIVNTLLLGGILNILSQSEQFDNAMDRVNDLENDNIQNKFRLESLENWMLKLNEKLDKGLATVDGTTNTKLEEQIDDVRKEFKSLKEAVTAAPASTSCLPKAKSCSKCGETFTRNFELENHMVHFHGLSKTFACDICGKTFYLKWRMEKHQSIHEGSHKACKYYKDGKTCPFDEVGCKFMHEEKETENTEEETSEVTLCIYCNRKFQSQQDLINHMGSIHMDQFHHLRQENSLISF